MPSLLPATPQQRTAPRSQPSSGAWESAEPTPRRRACVLRTIRRMSPIDPRRSSMRLVYAVAVGVIAWFATGALDLSGLTRTLIAWNLAGLTLLGLVTWIIVTTRSAETRRRAAAEDAGRMLVWIIVLVVSTLALFTATFVLTRSRLVAHRESTLMLILSLTTTIISWLLTHTAFTLRYAHLFYGGGAEGEGGIRFPQDPPEDPDDLDFAYFAFTIGMCFQVSDAEVSDRAIRRTVLAHAMLSFAYNTGIIALALSIVTSRLG
ncbi:MAG TPA: DUF1345 domain-containing protein [Kofleriaceae bacterium]|nr:DUF1345 domain-containing protein [Kofleriaceae bacterium]